jgi:hypothetical protein
VSRPKLDPIDHPFSGDYNLEQVQSRISALNALIAQREAIRREKTVTALHGSASDYGRAGRIQVPIPARHALDAYKAEIEKAAKDLQAEITRVTKALGVTRAAAAKTFQAVW